MTYDVSHLHLTFGGKFFETETWSCGLRIASTAGAAGDPPDEAAAYDFTTEHIASVADKVKAYWAALAGAVPPLALLQFVKLNAVQQNGKQYTGRDTVENRFTGIPGGSAQNQFPQIAVAVSLMTGLARGRAHTGRFYLPAGAPIAVDFNGNISTTVATAVGDASANFINALNDWSLIPVAWDPKVHVMSNVGAGTRREVKTVRVGRTIDTQRRRRAQIPELYQASSIAIA